MSAKPEAAPEAGPPVKSKKLLIIVGALVLVLAIAGGGAFYLISKQRAAADEENGEAPTKAAATHAVPSAPPAYLPLDNMVVNLADPGGERVAQVGITLEVLDAHASDAVKVYLPTIRSGILMLISQATAEELLKPEGKKKLAKDILRVALAPFGGGNDDHEEEDNSANGKKKKKTTHADYPVKGVLFSSFIIQ